MSARAAVHGHFEIRRSPEAPMQSELSGGIEPVIGWLRMVDEFIEERLNADEGLQALDLIANYAIAKLRPLEQRRLNVEAGIEHVCIQCGCSESQACPGGCVWAKPNLCSRCAR